MDSLRGFYEKKFIRKKSSETHMKAESGTPKCNNILVDHLGLKTPGV